MNYIETKKLIDEKLYNNDKNIINLIIDYIMCDCDGCGKIFCIDDLNHDENKNKYFCDNCSFNCDICDKTIDLRDLDYCCYDCGDHICRPCGLNSFVLETSTGRKWCESCKSVCLCGEIVNTEDLHNHGDSDSCYCDNCYNDTHCGICGNYGDLNRDNICEYCEEGED